MTYKYKEYPHYFGSLDSRRWKTVTEQRDDVAEGLDLLADRRQANGEDVTMLRFGAKTLRREG